jgi:hypothetical protein
MRVPSLFTSSGCLMTGQRGEYLFAALAALDGAMLRRIAGQNNPAVLFFSETGHARQRANAQKSGLINPNHLPANLRLQFFILQ